MNKTELVASVAEKAGLTKKDSEKAVNAVLATVTESLQKGEKVQLVGFGTFEVRERKARKAQNHRPKKKSQFLQQKFLLLKLVKA